MILFFEFLLLVSFLAVASNPSPYFAAFGLVVSAGVGCLILASGGASFLSLVLFLVYLGGMMVVFAYSAALVAEPFPEAWGSVGVMTYLVGYLFLLGVWWLVGGSPVEGCVWGQEFKIYAGDWFGVSMLFSWGGGMLLAGGWALLLTLFSVLELVRGHYVGVLRAVE